MMFEVVKAYDTTYSKTDCTTDLKYKIFKYAYACGGDEPQE